MPKFLIVNAAFYEGISAALQQGAEAALSRAGAAFESVSVPGALEIPAVIRFAIEGGGYDGFVALGCVIRGETTHYETVCEESARGLTWLAVEHQAAIGNGIITVENEEQAWARADMARADKGGAAAEAALKLVSLRARLQGAAA